MEFQLVSPHPSLLAIIVLEGFTIPHKGHRKKDVLHSNRRKEHGSHERHHSHHPVAIGAQRQTVPSPLQDFVLLSGSPLFHERPRASSDSKTNITQITTPPDKDQKALQETQGNGAAVNQTLFKLLGPEPLSSHPAQATEQHQENVVLPGGPTDQSGTGQVKGNGAEQNKLPAESKEPLKAPSTFVQELVQKIKESIKQGKEQEKPTNGTNSGAPSVAITLETPDNASSSGGVMTSLGNKPISQENPTSYASYKAVNLSSNGQSDGKNDSIHRLSVAENFQKENPSNVPVAWDVKPDLSQNPKPSEKKFPFNIPGVRNYGKATNESQAVEGLKQITDKETKLGAHENLVPNCHWKTTKGGNGAVITSVACSGEFHRPEDKEGGLDEAGNKPPPKKFSTTGVLESLGSKQMTAKNISTSETGGAKESHMQSKTRGLHWLALKCHDNLT